MKWSVIKEIRDLLRLKLLETHAKIDSLEKQINDLKYID